MVVEESSGGFKYIVGESSILWGSKYIIGNSYIVWGILIEYGGLSYSMGDSYIV